MIISMNQLTYQTMKSRSDLGIKDQKNQDCAPEIRAEAKQKSGSSSDVKLFYSLESPGPFEMNKESRRFKA
jgi:hypothetical protein